jgi:hypothetical protein
VGAAASSLPVVAYWTVTVPDMPGCSVQLYAKVPAVLKVRETEAADVFGMFAGALELPKVTLCVTLPKFHVTVVPTATAIDDGLNVLSDPAFTVFVATGVDGVPPLPLPPEPLPPLDKAVVPLLPPPQAARVRESTRNA